MGRRALAARLQLWRDEGLDTRAVGKEAHEQRNSEARRREVLKDELRLVRAHLDSKVRQRLRVQDIVLRCDQMAEEVGGRRPRRERARSLRLLAATEEMDPLALGGLDGAVGDVGAAAERRAECGDLVRGVCDAWCVWCV